MRRCRSAFRPPRSGSHTDAVRREAAGVEARSRRIMPILFSVADHVARVTFDRPDVLNAIDAASERRAAGDLGADRAGPRHTRRRADGSRRARVFHRRRHEGRLRRVGPRILGDAAPGRLRRDSAARDARCSGRSRASTVMRSAAASRWCWAATSWSRLEEATFGLPEARVGRLPLDGGMVLLQRQIPYRLAMGMLLTGRRIKAKEALESGSSTRSSRAPISMRRSIAGSHDILACAPLSVRAIKQVARRTAHMTAQEAQAARLPALVEALDSEDSRRRRPRLHREAQAGVEGEMTHHPRKWSPVSRLDDAGKKAKQIMCALFRTVRL